MIRLVDARRAARLILAKAHDDDLGVGLVLAEVLEEANRGRSRAVEDLIAGLAALSAENVTALDRASGGKASEGLRQFIAEAERIQPTRDTDEPDKPNHKRGSSKRTPKHTETIEGDNHA